MTTTLPLAFGVLQTRGMLRRVPVGGRLDQQRYRYVRWSPNPLEPQAATESTAFTELARRFFGWVGPSTLKEFQGFSGLGVKAAKDAVGPLGLVPVEPGSDRLLLADDQAAFAAFTVPREEQYALVSSLDSISAARRDVSSFVDASDRETVAKLTFGARRGSELMDLAAHAILDRGRLVGYWEFDADAQCIVWMTFSGKRSKALSNVVEETESFVRDQLGDARSFSLDSPKSRRPKLDEIRSLA